MKKSILILILIILISGCSSGSQNLYYDAHYDLKIVTENSEEAIKHLSIYKGLATYTILDENGEILDKYERELSETQYNDIAFLFEESEFFNLNDYYELVSTEDESVAEYSVKTANNKKKTIIVSPYSTGQSIDELKEVEQVLVSTINYILSTTEQDAKLISEVWIQSSPTFKYDGSELEQIQYYKQISFPETHVVIYNFKSRTAGYGDRTENITDPNVTYHKIEVGVVNRKVVSTVIDDIWDEMKQEFIEVEEIEMEYRPLQCVDTPWENWLKYEDTGLSNDVNESHLITTYYESQFGIKLLNYTHDNSPTEVCEACEICSRNYNLVTIISIDDVKIFLDDGWTILNYPDPRIRI